LNGDGCFRGNLDFFLERQSGESNGASGKASGDESSETPAEDIMLSSG